MKKILFFVALLLPLMVWAQERSVNDAAEIAAEFMNNQQALSPVRKAACSASSLSLAHTRAKLNSEAPAFYVFNRGNDAGYVIVSADNRTEDVLVYCEEGELDMDNINPNFAFWLNRLQEEISAANDENTYTTVEKKARKAANAVTAIGPLLKDQNGNEIKWDQESPYWNDCPMDLWKTSERCLTGCVATATAQIMFSWRYPAKGTGSHSYEWECCMNSQCSKTSTKTLSKDFSQVTFDWTNMKASYSGSSSTAAKAAVAELMYCCGVACDMGYGGSTIGGSGAWTDDMGYGLITYFGYTIDKFVTTYSKNRYENNAKYAKVATLPDYHWSASTTEIAAYFNADLEAGRPILMGGEDGSGGHEFVCDGRNSSGYFHINWGWSGESNNYCLLSALKPSDTSYNFSNNIDAIVGLRPATIDTVHVEDITVTPDTATLRINESTRLSATVLPTKATDPSYTWSSSNSAVATVTDAGVVKGISQGVAFIIATTTDGAIKDTATITVTNEILPAATFKLLTDLTNLKENDKIILVTTYNKTSYGATSQLTSTSNARYLGVEQVTIASDNVVTLDEESKVAVFTVAKSGSYYTLTEATNGALGATAAKKLQWNPTTATWSISLSGSNATIKCSNASYGSICLNYNDGNPRYCNYLSSSSTILSPMIFVKFETKPTAVAQVQTNTTYKKVLIGGQLYLIQGDHIYNLQGQLVR